MYQIRQNLQWWWWFLDDNDDFWIIMIISGWWWIFLDDDDDYETEIDNSEKIKFLMNWPENEEIIANSRSRTSSQEKRKRWQDE